MAINKDDEKRREELGARLRQAREFLDLSQDEAASAVGVSRSALSQIERGKRRVESMELARFANLYGQSVEALTGAKAPEPLPENVQALARQAAKLSDADREQLLRFAEFLQNKPAPNDAGGGDG